MGLSTSYYKSKEKALQLAKQHGWVIRKNCSNGSVMQLQEVDPTGHPIYYITHNANAAQLTKTTSLYAGGSIGLSLSGNSSYMAGKLGMWDGGKALSTHQEFAGAIGPRITHMDQATDVNEHTTHLAGTLIGRGVSAEARGMSFGASVKIWDFNDDLAEIGTAAKDLLLSNHSYGPVVGWVYNADRPDTDPGLKWEWWGNTNISQTEDYQFGFYSTKSSDLDRILYSNPYYLIVRSADNKHIDTGPPDGIAYYLRNTNTKSTITRNRNDGYDVIAGESNAKNVLTIGSVEATIRNGQPTSLSVALYSGWGPTDDGRIKPDLLGAGTRLYSAISSSDNAYGVNTGTSMASANVTGSLFLLQELYARLQNSTSNDGRFMRSATLRGLALHTADRINASGAIQTGIGPDYKQGWGVLNIEKAAAVLVNDNGAHLLSEQLLQQSGTFTTKIVAQGNEPLVVTICWTDPEGAATMVSAANVNNRLPKLVNDLDVRVSDGSTTAHPWTLDPNQPNQSASTGDNIRDNVEQIFITNPIPGQTYTITVTHKGQLKYSAQPFSLIVSGLFRKTCPLAVNLQPGKDTSICAGATINLWTDQVKVSASGATASGLTYEWLKNGVVLSKSGSSSYQATQAGTYSVRVTDSNGCMGISRSIIIQHITPTATISPATDQWLCDTRPSVQLTASAELGTQFEWLRNGQAIANGKNQSITVAQSGIYQVRITQRGCQGITTAINVGPAAIQIVDLLPTDVDIALPRGASVQLQVPATIGAIAYQWLRNDQSITNAITEKLLVSEPGQYRVKITQQSCGVLSTIRTVRWSDSPTDSSLFVTPSDTTLLLYPNPTNAYIYIRYTRPSATYMDLTIYDALGRICHATQAMDVKAGSFESTINVSALPYGYYFIRLSDGYRYKETRFFKR